MYLYCDKKINDSNTEINRNVKDEENREKKENSDIWMKRKTVENRDGKELIFVLREKR